MIHNLLRSIYSSLKLTLILGLLAIIASCNTPTNEASKMAISSMSSYTGSAYGGNVVTISGSNLGFTETVYFGSNLCTGLSISSASLISCTVPSSVVVGAVTVKVSGRGNHSATTSYTYVSSGPTITSFSPSGGNITGGSTLRIVGTNFLADTTIVIGGSTCVPGIMTSTTMTCTTPAKAAGAYSIIVTNYDAQTVTSATNYTYAIPPTLSSVSPAFASTSGGATITVTGTDFVSGASVLIGGSPCTPVTFVNSTTLTCISPGATALVGNVKVTNPDYQTSTIGSAFTFIDPPVLSSVAPAAGAMAGGTIITLSGLNFISGATVTVDGVNCPATYVSATRLTCVTPLHATPGTYAVVVTNPSTLTSTLAAGYIYRNAPTVTTVSPTAGALTGGGVLTVNGTGFITPPVVTVGGTSCANATLSSSTSLTCTLPAHSAGAKTVQVTNSDSQSGSLATAYTYNPLPTISAVAPAYGDFTGGDTITITGTGFITGAVVAIGATNCTTTTFNSATSLDCLTPAGTVATVPSVIVTNPDLQAVTQTLAHSYVADPTILTVSPSYGALLGGTTLTITGTNFWPSATVDVGGVSCGTVVIAPSRTSLTCITGAHAGGAVDVQISNTNGQTTGLVSSLYTYQDPPTVASVTPNNGLSIGGTAVTIAGANFELAGATVDIGGSPCANPVVVDANTITCDTGAHATGGSVTVTVTNANLQSGSLAAGYNYRAFPVITSVSPAGGDATLSATLTITGTGFIAGATVDIGGGACAVTTVTSTSITCTAAPHAAGAEIMTVTNVDGQTGTKTPGYTYLDAPTVTSIAPIGGSLAGGTTVTLTGTQFFAGATVSVGGNPCTSPTVLNATSMTCITAAHAAGAVSATVTNIDAQTGTGGTFTYQNGPQVFSSTPTFGPIGGGTDITITGAGFVTGATINIGSNPCTLVTFVGATTYTCRTPLSVTSGPKTITVIHPDTQSATLATGFIYLLAPTVTTVSPSTGALAGGATITLTGTGFFVGATVTVGGLACTSPTVISSTSMTCVVPTSTSGAKAVVVTNTDTQTGTLGSGYTYQGPPTITSVSPSAGAIAGGTVITVTGTNFVTGAVLRMSGTTCATTFVSSVSLTCITPAKAAGVYDMTITNPDTQVGSISGVYTYKAAPTVTSVSPNIGAIAGGTTITITGNNLISGATATVGGTACTSPTVTSLTTMTCVTPAKAAASYPIVVTNSDTQTGSMTNAYTYRAAPTIASIATTSGPIAGGTSIVLTGTGFVTGAVISIGGTNCTTSTFTSATSMTCVSPAKAAGVYAITVTNSDGQPGTLGAVFTYRGAPTVTSISPALGPLTGGTALTITGTGFYGSPTVTISGTTCASVTVVTSTSITCTTVAKAAGTYTLSVTNPDTQVGNLLSAFTYRAPPTISSVSPNSGDVLGGTNITITGTGFIAAPTVTVGGVACTVISVSATSVICTTGANAAGVATAILTNTDGQAGVLASAYTYRAAPTFLSVSPVSGLQAGGTAITITGTGFYTGATVSIDGSACISPTVVSSTSITCTTPSHAGGAVAITVTNADTQAAVSGAVYTYTSIPVLAFQTGTVSPNPPNPDSYGSTSTNITHTYTVKNIGEGNSSSLSVSLSGGNTAAWLIGTDNCTGNIIGAGASCTIQYTFLGAFLTTGSYSTLISVSATSGGSTTNTITGSVP